MLIGRRYRLTDAEERIVMRWCESTAPTDPERVTYVARTAGLEVADVQRALQKDYIQESIYDEQSRQRYETGIDISNVLRQLGRLTYFDARLLVDAKDGTPIPLHQLPEEIVAAIQGIKVTRRLKNDGTQEIDYEYRFADRIAAVTAVMKHLGLFERDNKQKADFVDRILADIYNEDSRLPKVDKHLLNKYVTDITPNVPEPATDVAQVEFKNKYLP